MTQVKETPIRRIPPFWLESFQLVLVALLYWIAVRIGLLLVSSEGVATIWPASGVALAILLSNPKRRWASILLVIFAINLLSNLTNNTALPVSIGFAFINILEAFFCAWALFAIRKARITFDSLADIFALLLVAVFINGFTAIFGAAISTLTLGVSFFDAWRIWWVADGLGILLITTFLVTWTLNPGLPRFTISSRLLEALGITFVLILFSVLVFGVDTLAEQPILDEYVLFPLLFWLAFRFGGPRSMSSALLLVAGIAFWGTLQQHGIFSQKTQTLTDELIFLQVYLSIMSVSGLLLSAVIAERKRDTDALKTAEANYRNIFENAPVGLYQSTVDGRFLTVNQHMAQMFGFTSPAEMISSITNIAQQLYADPSMRQTFIDNFAGQGQVKDLVLQYRHKPDDSPFWGILNARLVRDQAGQPLYYEGFLQDIDERIQAEERLRESEKRYVSILENAPLGFFQSYPDGGYRSVNPSMARIFGYTSPAEMISSITDITQQIYIDQAARKEFKRLLASNDRVFNFVALHRRKDGSPFWTSANARVIHDENGQPLYYEGFIQDIDEAIKAEKTIQESQKFVQATMDSLSAHICVLDADGTILAVNKAWMNFAQQNPPVAGNVNLGVNYLTICDNTTGPEAPMAHAFAAGIRAVLRGEQEEFDLEYPCHAPHQQRWFIGRVMRFADPLSLRVVIAHENITARKLVEDALRESEASLKSSQQVAHIGHWTWDTVTNRVTWSDEMYRIFGITPNAFDGDLDKLIMRSIHPEDREKVIESNNTVLTQQKPMPLEYRIIWPDQSVRTVWAEAGTNTRDDNGKIIKLSGIVQDITERKRAEYALDESNRFAISIADNIPGMLGYWTSDLRCRFANREYQTWFGRTSEQMLGIHIHELLGEELFKKNEPYIHAALRGEAQQFERKLIKPTGEAGYTWAQYIPHYVNGKVEGFFALVSDITQIKRDQERLRISEEKWRSLFAILPVGITILDDDRQLVDFNPALGEILGITTDGLREGAYTHRKYLRADGTPMLDAEFPTVRAMQEQIIIQSAQMGIVKEDGAIIWVEISAAPLSLPDAACVVVTTDVTRRKQTELALQQVNQRLSLAQRSASAGLWDWDMTKDFYSWSPELYDLLGVDPAITPTVDVWRNSIHEQDRQHATDHILAALQAHLPIADEYRIVRSSGEVLWVNALGNTTYDAQGKPQRMSGICIDITARKQTEQALLESEARLKGIVASAMDGIVMVDSSQHITLFNEAAEKIFGFSASRVIGQPLDIILPYESRGLHKRHIQRFGETGITTRSMSALMEIIASRATGETFPLEASISQFMVTGEKFYTAIVRDVTERKQMEKTLRDSLLEKEVLLKEVHHRVKNNLQIVSSLLSMQANSAKNEKVTQALEESKNRVRAMALIHEKLYRSESLEYIQAEEYIPELISHLSGSMVGFKKDRIKFDIQITTTTLDIGKAIPCGMIITELTSNALKYAFPQERPGIIQVHLEVEAGKIMLMVSDNGIGLPPEIDFNHPETLGLELVSILSRQLKAELQVIRQPGTTYILTFRN